MPLVPRPRQVEHAGARRHFQLRSSCAGQMPPCACCFGGRVSAPLGFCPLSLLCASQLAFPTTPAHQSSYNNTIQSPNLALPCSFLRYRVRAQLGLANGTCTMRVKGVKPHKFIGLRRRQESTFNAVQGSSITREVGRYNKFLERTRLSRGYNKGSKMLVTK